MKKFFIISIILFIIGNSLCQVIPEKFSLEYKNQTTLTDSKAGSSRSQGSIMSHNVNGEYYFFHHFQLGLYGSFFMSDATIKNNLYSNLLNYSLGGIFKINFCSAELKFKLGYFGGTKSSNYFSKTIGKMINLDSNTYHGIDMGTMFTLAQKDYSFFPKVEIFVSTKVSLKGKAFVYDEGKISKIEPLSGSIVSYSYGATLNVYRIDFMSDYYISPTLGMEKSEALDCDLMLLKIGISMDNEHVRSAICRTGFFVSSYKDEQNGIIISKKTIYGMYFSFNPIGLFIHRIKNQTIL